ncbi:ABC transporter permease [Mycoplasma leonicaptivi]|uniref:ABC transporter permease n=1 Tax=Mycoplasma leonicaptivi TaxID=36742 RepID=UPI0012EBC8F4|nr:ABC transporter permease [Mycoplasma leonicaptivi]
MLLLFLRSFPTVIFILLFKSSFETYLAAFAIFFWGTWLWMHRYFSEIIENSDVKQFWIDVNLGTKRFKSFYKNIVINNKNRFIMNSILAFESNLRWSTVLGTIGIYGIGILFDLYKNKFEYLGISLFYIVLIVFLLEIFIVFYNKYLSKNKSVMTQNINYNRNFKYWYKKAILFILYAFILVITIISLRDLFTQKINFYVIGNYFKNIFRPDFSYLKNNIWFYYQDYLDIFIFTYTSIIISFIFCYFTSFIIAEKFFFWKTSVFSKFILVIIKSIPILVYFSFFISIFNQNTALVLGLSIVAYRSFVKQISEKINSKTNKNCDILSNLGWSKWKIYKIYIFPQLQNDIKGIISFEFESTFRNVITYGLFTSVISIPNHLNLFQERTEYTKIIPLILPAMIFFILLETFFWIYKNNYFKIWFKKIQKI